MFSHLACAMKNVVKLPARVLVARAEAGNMYPKETEDTYNDDNY
jgi:hypothetical protein